MTRRPTAVLASLALGATLLTGCSEGEAERAVDRAADRVKREVGDLPDVNWEKHGKKLKRRVDQLAEKADCSELRKLAKREANDTEVTRYIKAQLRQAC
ncbi:MAG TPA: hypothetical protein VFG72_13935 [Marmoricola sp.]|nr:hypothetical protein [Marmoricola sp.]